MERDEDDVKRLLGELEDAVSDERDAASRSSALEEEAREAGATVREISDAIGNRA